MNPEHKPKNQVDDLFHESRSFEPSETFKSHANIKDLSLYEDAKKDRLKFWEQCALRLDWFKPWDQVLKSFNL